MIKTENIAFDIEQINKAIAPKPSNGFVRVDRNDKVDTNIEERFGPRPTREEFINLKLQLK